MSNPKFFNVDSTDSSSPTVSIDGRIGSSFFEFGVEFDEFKNEIDNLGNVRNIQVDIGSPGGNVDIGLAIYNYLRSHAATIHTNVISQASSIASVIFLAGDKRTMMKGTTAYIHEPLTGVEGYADDLFKVANYLEITRENIIDIYQERTGQTRATLAKLMKDETLMNVAEAFRRGFATHPTDDNQAQNQSMLQYTHMTTEVVNLNKLAVQEAEDIMMVKQEDFDNLKADFEALQAQLKDMTNSQEASDAAQASTDAAHADSEEETTDPTDVVKAEAEAEAEAKAEVEAKAKYGAEIRAICAAAKVPEVAAEYITAGTSVEQVRSDLFSMVTTGDVEIQNSVPVTKMADMDAEISNGWKSAFKNVK